jgi:hypothetical protein
VIALAPSPAFAQALWLVAAIMAAGSLHVLWLKSRLSAPFRRPLDSGRHWRGRPLLGRNKTLAGLMVMPPATGLCFAAVGSLRPHLPAWLEAGTWNLPLAAYATLGFTAGLAFMLAELPNSFLKRRLGIGAGEAAPQGLRRWLLMALDRCDSTFGVLVVLTLAVPMTAATWLWVLLMGPAVHALFSLWLRILGVKGRVL